MITAPIILAYFVSWGIYGRSYFVTDIPADKLTHVNYAFANIGSDGRIALGDVWADVEKAFPGDTWDQPLQGNFNQLLKLKQMYPHLRTLISVGGWTWSQSFSSVAATSTSRAIFAQSCASFVQTYGFDGVDLDWEYPVSGGLSTNIVSPSDTQNYVLLLQAIREALNALNQTSGKPYLLTVAVGASPQLIANLDPLAMSVYVDWINMMTFDFHGSWESITGHNAPLYENSNENVNNSAPEFMKSRYNCDAAAQAYIATGAPRSKLIMSMPLYGRGWQGVTSTIMNGYSQPASTQIPMGTWEPGVFDYDDLENNYVPSYTRYWDNASKVPFLYNRNTMIWITYDDVQSIELKSQYINQKGLGGVSFWELSGDRQNDLINVTFEAFYNGSYFTPISISTTVPGTIGQSISTTTATQSTIGNAIGITKKTTTVTSSGTISSILTSSTSSNIFGSSIPQWTFPVSYQLNDRVTYQNQMYRCILAHTSQSDWTPAITPVLWQLVSTVSAS